MLSNNEKTLYSRHLLLPEIGLAGQEKLKAAKVLVIGAGGLGCPILQYLTAAGVGTIGIVDGDKVNVSNLQRQILFTIDDIGKSKASCVANRLKLLNPYTKFDVYNTFLTTNNAIELFEQYDVVVDGSDNFPTRYLCNDAAVLTGKPLVFGSIFKFEGQVSVFNYNNGPTYRCLYPTPPANGTVPNCAEIGVMGVLPGIIGAYQANEVLKIICGLEGVLSCKLLSINILTNQHLLLNFKKDETICVNALVDYEVFCGVDEALSLAVMYDDYLKNQSAFTLVDIRSLEEHLAYNIGGFHLSEIDIRKDLQQLVKIKNPLLYCNTSNRCLQLIKDLDLEVCYLKNGINALL